MGGRSSEAQGAIRAMAAAETDYRVAELMLGCRP